MPAGHCSQPSALNYRLKPSSDLGDFGLGKSEKMLQEIVADNFRGLFDIGPGPQFQPQIDIGQRLFDRPPQGFGIVRGKLVGNDYFVRKSGRLDLEDFKPGPDLRSASRHGPTGRLRAQEPGQKKERAGPHLAFPRYRFCAQIRRARLTCRFPAHRKNREPHGLRAWRDENGRRFPPLPGWTHK